MKQYLLVLVLAAAPLLAQPVGVGFKGGILLNDAYETVSNFDVSDTQPYSVGAYVELRLPLRLAIEVDALRQTIPGYRGPGIRGGDVTNWTFPIVLKYRFSGGTVRPYVEAGGSFRRFSDLTQVGNFVTGRLGNDVDAGFVVGGGVEFKLLFLRISPEVRFTRWGTNSIGSGFQNILNLNRNQGEVLVGIGF